MIYDLFESCSLYLSNLNHGLLITLKIVWYDNVCKAWTIIQIMNLGKVKDFDLWILDHLVRYVIKLDDIDTL